MFMWMTIKVVEQSLCHFSIRGVDASLTERLFRFFYCLISSMVLNSLGLALREFKQATAFLQCFSAHSKGVFNLSRQTHPEVVECCVRASKIL